MLRAVDLSVCRCSDYWGQQPVAEKMHAHQIMPFASEALNRTDTSAVWNNPVIRSIYARRCLPMCIAPDRELKTREIITHGSVRGFGLQMDGLGVLKSAINFSASAKRDRLSRL